MISIIRKIISLIEKIIGISIKRTKKRKKQDLRLYHELYRKNTLDNKRFYNIGAGKFFHPYWTNIDKYSDWYTDNRIDIEYDLFSHKPLGVGSSTARLIYSSHTFEHLDNQSVQYVLSECYRILANNGGLRVTVPDIDLHYSAYKRGDIYYFSKTPSHSIGYYFLHEFATQVCSKFSDDEIDNIFQKYSFDKALNWFTNKCSIETQNMNLGEHINWWNYIKLKSMLRKAGFSQIYLSSYGQSNFAVMRNTSLFDNTHPEYSIYVEAVKNE